MAGLGLDVEARFAIYGLGVLPAMRIQLRDAKALRAAANTDPRDAEDRLNLRGWQAERLAARKVIETDVQRLLEDALRASPLTCVLRPLRAP